MYKAWHKMINFLSYIQRTKNLAIWQSIARKNPMHQFLLNFDPILRSIFFFKSVLVPCTLLTGPPFERVPSVHRHPSSHLRGTPPEIKLVHLSTFHKRVEAWGKIMGCIILKMNTKRILSDGFQAPILKSAPTLLLEIELCTRPPI